MGTTAYHQQAEALAAHAFGVMRLYCKEYGLTKGHVVSAIAALCVELRETYPEGTDAFDKLAVEAQKYYERSK